MTLVNVARLSNFFYLWMMLPLSNQLIEGIICDKFSLVEAIYIFGSFADNSATESSDVDIAFMTSDAVTIPDLKIFGTKQELEIALGKDVDLIHLNSVSTVFQFQIVTTGFQLFVNDTEYVLNYEARVLSQYQRLHEERKHILEEIILSGKVYVN